MLTTKSGMINKSWTRSPIPFQHMSFWCSFLKLHPRRHYTYNKCSFKIENQIRHVYLIRIEPPWCVEFKRVRVLGFSLVVWLNVCFPSFSPEVIRCLAIDGIIIIIIIILIVVVVAWLVGNLVSFPQNEILNRLRVFQSDRIDLFST